MTIAATVESCLERHRLPYALISHPRAVSSRETAAAAAVAPHQIAKAVLLHDERGYLMVVLPSHCYVPLRELSERLGRNLRLAQDSELAALFGDCEAGAVPPLGPDYGIETLVDEALFRQPHVCFVPGGHTGLLCVTQDAFRTLMRDARPAAIACAAEPAPDPAPGTR
jgi:Ala-tRNA(Pro) deacylase